MPTFLGIHQGKIAKSLILASGETLAEYLQKRLSPAGNLDFQLPAPCRLDRNLKTDFQSIDNLQVLEKISTLPNF